MEKLKQVDLAKGKAMHKAEYRKNWCMVHEDKRYSKKREQAEKNQLKEAANDY